MLVCLQFLKASMKLEDFWNYFRSPNKQTKDVDTENFIKNTTIWLEKKSRLQLV